MANKFFRLQYHFGSSILKCPILVYLFKMRPYRLFILFYFFQKKNVIINVAFIHCENMFHSIFFAWKFYYDLTNYNKSWQLKD